MANEIYFDTINSNKILLNSDTNRLIFDFSVTPLSTLFITTWKTDNTGVVLSNSDQVKLPLHSSGTFNFDVDWGDGSGNTITAYNQAEITHTYSTAGTYDITISGTCYGFGFLGETTLGDNSKLIDVKNWGNMRFHNVNFQLASTNLTNISATDSPDFTDFTNPDSQFFRNSRSLIDGIGHWDVSTINGFGNWFVFNDVFNDDLSLWDVSNATIFRYMFYKALVFNCDLSDWDMSGSTNVRAMFEDTLVDFDMGGWNVEEIGYSPSNDFNYFLKDTTLSTPNYDATLQGWSTQSLALNQTIDFGFSKYSTSGLTYRNILTGTYNWIITDGGAA